MNKLVIGFLFTLLLFACDSKTPENNTTQTELQQTTDTSNKMQIIKFLGLQSKIPDDWIAEPVSSSMRLAQFKTPAADGHNDANLILFYFGQGQGGTPAANITRWQSQFYAPQGGRVEAKVKTMEVSNMPVTMVELNGSYARSIGMGTSDNALAQQTLLASIVETSQGNVTIQLFGDAATVAAQHKAYITFIRSIRPDKI
jgi:hypothetical protein